MGELRGRGEVRVVSISESKNIINYLSILIIIGLRDDADVFFFFLILNPNNSLQIKFIKIKKFK